MDVLKKLYDLLGYKIHFTTSDGEYEGIVKFIIPQVRKVTIEHVFYVPDKEYMGDLDFFVNEFQTIKVISDIKYNVSENKIPDNRLVSKRSEDCVKYLLDDLESIPESEIYYEEDLEKEDFVLDVPPEFADKLPKDCVILKSLDSEFEVGLDYISKLSVIGVSFEGPLISRNGKLSWICISTPRCVFLFDVEALGANAFENGLRNIFQNRNIEKVIHDCRQPADCLAHLYSTKLVNVFDTQVADFVVNKQRFSEQKLSFKYISSLDTCLVSHLQVPQEFLHNRRKHLSYPTEVEFFSLRPITHEFQNVLVKNVIYLCSLKEKLADLMQNPFRQVVDVYLTVLAGASDAELLLEPSVPDKIPLAVLLSNIQTVSFKRWESFSSLPSHISFRDSTGRIVLSNKLHPDSKNFKNISNLDKGSSFSEFEGTNTVSLCGIELESKNTMLKGEACTDTLSERLQNVKINNEISNHDSVDTSSKTISKDVEHIQIFSSNMEMDRVFHKLVNNNQSDHSGLINFQLDSVSKFTVRNFRSGIGNAGSDKLSTTQSEITDAVDDQVEDTKEMWDRLRASFNVSDQCATARKNVIFVPAGAL